MRLTTLLIAIVLLTTATYAADASLEAQQSSLDEKASRFMIQVETALSYGEDKNVDIDAIQELRDQFNMTFNNALTTDSKEDFKDSYAELRLIAKKLKKEVKNKLEEHAEDLRKDIKEKLEEKKDVLEEKVKHAEEKQSIAQSLKVEIKNLLNVTHSNETTEINITKINVTHAKETALSLKDAFIEHLRTLDED